jgi:hypothetical protein
MLLGLWRVLLVSLFEQESSIVEEECRFGCFSPRVRPCTGPHRDVPVAYESEDADEIMAPGWR